MADIDEQVEDERVEWIVCGRLIGTATGWDQADTFCMFVYGLIPAPGYAGPPGDVTINFESGTIESTEENGNVIRSDDLIDAIKSCAAKEVDDD